MAEIISRGIAELNLPQVCFSIKTMHFSVNDTDARSLAQIALNSVHTNQSTGISSINHANQSVRQANNVTAHSINVNLGNVPNAASSSYVIDQQVSLSTLNLAHFSVTAPKAFPLWGKIALISLAAVIIVGVGIGVGVYFGTQGKEHFRYMDLSRIPAET